MARSSPPKRIYIDEFEVDSIPEGVDPKVVEETNRRFALLKPNSYLIRRGKTTKSRRPNIPTITPKSRINPPVVPNAPVKSRKTIRKPDVRRKKLDYTEPEVEQNNTMDSGIFSVANESVTSFRNDKIPSGSKKPEKKQCQTSQHRGNLSKCPQTEQGRSSSTRQERSATNRSKSISSKNLGKTQESSIEEAPILAPNPEDVRLNRLRWLEIHSDDGTWIECCRKECGKWRFVVEYDDPAEVPEKWYCIMNADPYFASCDVPEDEIPTKVSKQLIENKYRVGSIVWARLDGYPWWPAIIQDCPKQLQYYQIDESSGVPTKYHVIFFGEKKLEYAWLPDKDLKPYAKNPRETVVKRTKFRKKDFKKQLDIVCAMANEALQFSPSERIERFGLVTRMTRKDSRTSKNSSGNKRRYFLTEGKDRCSENVNAPSSSIIYDRELEKKTYNVGDIVWAHPDKYPWWPAMIDVCPNILSHFQFPKLLRAPIEYHVVYFQEKTLEWDWRAEQHLIPFASNPKRESVAKKTKYGKKDYRRELDDACQLARVAQKLSVKERLERFSEIARLSPTLKKQKLGDIPRVPTQSSDSGSSCNRTHSSSCLSDVMEWAVTDFDKEIVSIFRPNANEAGTSSRPELSYWKKTISESTTDSSISDSGDEGKLSRFQPLNLASFPVFSPICEPDTDTLPTVASHRNELTSSNYPSIDSEPDVEKFFRENCTPTGINRAFESEEESRRGSSEITISTLFDNQNSGSFSHEERSIPSEGENHSDFSRTDDPSLFSDDSWQPDESNIDRIISSISDQEQQECPMNGSDSSDKDVDYERAQRDYILAKLFA